MKLTHLFTFVIIILALVNVTLSNHRVDDGFYVNSLRSAILSLKHDNTILRGKIAQAGSLSSVLPQIQALGYLEPAKIVTLNESLNVASRQ